MKKLLSLAFLLIVMMVILTGCVTVDYQVTVNKDGTGKISYVYGFEKSFLEQMGTSIEDMTADMKQTAETEGFSIESYSDDNVEGFRAIKEVEDITSGLSLSEAFGEANVKDSEDNNIKIEKGLFGANYSQNGVIDLSSMEDMSMYGVTLKYSVNLPVKAGANNATEVSADGKTLSWELKGGEKNSIEFTAKGAGSIMTIIILVVVLVVAGAVAAIVLVAGKKGKNDVVAKENLEDKDIEIEDEE